MRTLLVNATPGSPALYPGQEGPPPYHLYGGAYQGNLLIRARPSQSRSLLHYARYIT